MSNPANGSTSNDNAPDFGFSGATSGQTIQLYSGSACSTTMGGAVTADAGGAGTLLARTVPAGDGLKNFSYTVNGGACGNTNVSYTLDTNAPSASSITLGGASPTNASSVTFTATFSESVVTVASSDFSLVTGGSVAGASITSVTGSGSTRTITVNTGSGSGTLQLNLNDADASIKDAAGNSLATTTLSGATYTIDKTAPSTAITWTLSSPSDGSTSNDTTPTLGWTAGAEVGASLQIYSDATCTAPNLLATQGSIASTGSINLTTSGSGGKNFYFITTDSLGNASACTNTSRSYTLDLTGPTISSIALGGSSPTANASVTFTVTFSETVSGVDTTDFALTTTGVTGASITSVTGSGPYTVTVNTGTGSGTIRLDLIDNNSITDAYSNLFGGAGAQNYTSGSVYTIDRTAPTLAGISWTQTSPANSTTSNDTTPALGFSGYTEAAGTIRAYDDAGCTSQVGILTSIASTSGTVNATVSGNGTRTFYFTAADALGNVSACTATGMSYTLDTTAPTISSITLGGSSPTNSASVTYTVTFSEAMATVVAADFSLVQSGGVSGAAISSVTGSGTSWTVTVNTGSNSGTLQLNLNDVDASIKDTAGNGLSSTTFNGSTYTIDKTPPSTALTWTLSSPSDGSTSNDTTPILGWTAGAEVGSTLKIFSDVGCAVGNLLATQASITATGTFNLTTSGSGSKVFYFTATDTLGNVSACTNTSKTYTLDVTGPTVSTITLGSSSPTNASSVTFAVTFSESVTGVDSTDFALTTTGVTGASLTSVTGSGAGPYTVTVNTGTGTGTIRLDLNDNNSIIDAYTNVFGGAGTQNYTTGPVYSIDRTPPSALTWQTIAPSGTSNSTSPVLSFSGFLETSGSVTLWANSATCTNASVGTTSTFSAGTGSITASVSTSELKTFYYRATDPSGNTSACASTGLSYTLDTVAPSLSSLALTAGSLTNATSVTFTASFSESVTPVVAADLSLTTTGVTGASISSVTGSGAGPYTITVNTGTGSGTVQLNLADANASIKDAGGNTLSSTSVSGGAYNAVYTIDKTAPTNGLTWTMSSPSHSSTSNDTTPDLTFSSAEVGATVKVFTGFDGTNCTGNVASQSNVLASGTMTPTLSGDGLKTFYYTIEDAAGNVSPCTVTGRNYTLDTTPPTVSSIVRASSNITNASQVSFTVTFSESVTGVDSTDFTLNTTGLTSTSIASISGSGTTYTVVVNTGSGTGTLQLRLTDDNTIKDSPAGNVLAGAGTQNFTTGETYTIDKTAPTVNLSSNPTNPAYSRSATFNFTANDTGGGSVSSVQCSLDGGAYAACDSTTQDTVSGLTSGDHTMAIRAIDTAGNTGNATSYTWEVIPPQVSQFALADTFACAIVNGAAKCWGDNTYGQLGDGTTINKSTPTQVSGLTSGVTQIVTGSGSSNMGFACALVNSAVKCWGYGGHGQLGNNSTANSSTPVSVSGLSYGVDEITAGYYHACARTGPMAQCWGANSNGRLGDGTTTNRSAPATVSGTPLTYTVQSIAASGTQTCIVSNGAMYCWGSNASYKLGDGTQTSRYTPTAVTNMTSGMSLFGPSFGGWEHTCANKNGQLFCWGLNDLYQLGLGHTTTQTTAQLVDTTGYFVKAISTTNKTTCHLNSAGAMRCVGENASGQMGTANTTNTTAFTSPSGLSAGVNQIQVTNSFGGAIQHGALKLWGNNFYGQLGDGTTTTRLTPTVISAIPAGVQSVVAAGASETTCAVVAGGLKCWGFNGSNNLVGDGTIGGWIYQATDHATYAASAGIASVGPGYNHMCVVINGGVKCWGANSYGQLGDGATTASTTPVNHSSFSSSVEAVSSGSNFSCVLRAGAVKCWGLNTVGQLGNTTNTNSLTAVTAVASGARKLASNFSHSCAIVEGSVQCWGSGTSGQLGIGGYTDQNTPYAVRTSMLLGAYLQGGITDVATGYRHSCAIANGYLYCWGDNVYGQLGDGSTTATSRAVAVSVKEYVFIGGAYPNLIFDWVDVRAKQVAAGQYHTCALGLQGNVFCWGRNNKGQLGNGTTIDNDSPVAVTGLSSGVEAISVGMNHSCAFTRGKVYCWGAGTSIGNGTGVDSSTPVTVKGL